MKRLVCCFDGTWNDESDENALTNVVRLKRLIPARDTRGVHQLVRYVVGIGTGYTGRTAFLLGASGIEVGDRIRTGYRFLVDHYELGDEIYIFGFSRGAFEARSLAGLIARVGIGQRASPFDVDQAWKVYSDPNGQKQLADRLRPLSIHPVPIKCVGVWDTVGNIGNPLNPDGLVGKYLSFHDTALSPSVEIGLHALSIDEQRGPFLPTLWTLPKGGALSKGQHVEQVWFAGTHCDVGGGFADHGLSDISLNWMAQRVMSLTDLEIDMNLLQSTARPDPTGEQHSSTAAGLFKWSTLLPAVRLVDQDLGGLSTMRRMLARAWRTSWTGRKCAPVNESIHPSVLERFDQDIVERVGAEARQFKYRPSNLAAALQRKHATREAGRRA